MLNENEIRPDHLKAEQAERLRRDIDKLMRRVDEFVEVDCPACNSAQRRPRWMKYGLDYVECEDCNTVYVSPRPSPDALQEYYSNSENYKFFAEKIFPASEPARKEKIFRPRARRTAEICDRLSVDRDTLIEVGPGFGTFCQVLKEEGLFRTVRAVEPTPELAAACRARGVDVVEARIEDAVLEAASADVVASFEVIEHLFEPLEFVVGCRRLIKPGGLLVLTCPNVRGFEIGVLGPASDSVDVEHLNYFHPRSLQRLLERADFEVVETFTPGELDAELVRKKMLSGEFDDACDDFLREALIDRWDDLGGPLQTFIRDSGLSSHLWIAARRI